LKAHGKKQKESVLLSAINFPLYFPFLWSGVKKLYGGRNVVFKYPAKEFIMSSVPNVNKRMKSCAVKRRSHAGKA
jgi:hypothetical protein